MNRDAVHFIVDDEIEVRAMMADYPVLGDDVVLNGTEYTVQSRTHVFDTAFEGDYVNGVVEVEVSAV